MSLLLECSGLFYLFKLMRNSLITLLLFISICSFQITAQAQDAWQVDGSLSMPLRAEFSVNEGTWMNLDISPDGQTIIFDLLGDIYRLPITGGQAEALTHGPAFDVQPRYSPDGSHISFTSDRNGADNIWTLNLNDGEYRQITDENFRLLNNAVWTPDGTALIARKHFTSTRSIGAGEMWMYASEGNVSGIQMTVRKNDQQDVGEPAVSPDGRYLYFSEDVSAGGFFQYNKDPNGQIYIIRRLDRETGELTDLVTGSGGAVRPTPSPDGRWLAFVRRIGINSVLHLFDLKSGAQIPLYNELDHDQQEAWAVFGVYPNMAWTPDSKDIVFWAGGKIRRIQIDTREVTEIPFTAQVSQRLAEPARANVPVYTDRFRARMLRDAATSPDGSRLIFHAAGYLYQVELPNGNPQRLTQSEQFEYQPAFSADGNNLVYTSWNDQDLGAVWIINLQTGEQRRLTTEPGYYFHPQFSPDGTNVVYRRGSGNTLLGFLYGLEPGVYWQSVSSGEMHKVSAEGRQPRFDPNGQRIYYLTGGGKNKSYHSRNLHGGDEVTHLTSEYATDIVPSPDGRWIAFQEAFDVFLTPFPKAGRAVTLSAVSRQYPVKRLSSDGGGYIHWSADSQSVHWLMGPEYFSQAIDDNDAVIQSIELDFASDRPDSRLLFTNARVITMSGDQVLEDTDVLVVENKIQAVGQNLEADAETTVIDASGKTIMPGIFDVHGHANHFFSGPTPQTNWVYYANLAHGVTSLHDPSANTATVFTLSEMVKSGRITGPRIFSTGGILYGADGDFRVEINSLDDARKHLRRLKSVGAFSVKSYNQPRREQRQQIVAAAKEQDMLVVTEGGSTFYTNLTMILDGPTGIEHNLPVAPLYQDVIQLWQATSVGYTPTLVVSFGGISGEYYWYQHDNVWEDQKLLRYFPKAAVYQRSRRRLKLPEDDFYHIQVTESVKEVSDAGISVHTGGHGQLQGLAAHWELWMLHQGGMTALEAIRAATIDGARYLGMDQELGSIETGKLADFLLLNSNPLDNIRSTNDISMVIANGRVFDVGNMDEVYSRSQPRGLFYWEKEKANSAGASVNPWGEGHAH